MAKSIKKAAKGANVKSKKKATKGVKVKKTSTIKIVASKTRKLGGGPVLN